MTKDKENAFVDFLNMTTESWTWARLTIDERKRCTQALSRAIINGNYKQRTQQLHDVYYSFLLALDYKPVGWRETDKEAPLF